MITYEQINGMDEAFADVGTAFMMLDAARNAEARDDAFALFRAAGERYRAAKAGHGWDANGAEAV